MLKCSQGQINSLKLPSKKVVVVGLVGVVIIVGTLLFIKGGNSATGEDERDNIVASAPNVKDLAEIDSDMDGLRDWEEALWNTDPKNPDTDGDGTSDGNEATEQNKLVETSTTKESAMSSQVFSVTNELAKGVFANYMQTKSGDVPQQIVDSTNLSLVDQALTAGQIKSYSEKDIITLPETSQSALTDYGQKIGIIIQNNIYHTKQDEPELMKQLLESRDTSDAKNLADAALVYKVISDKLLAIPVPKVPNVIAFHLNLINSYYGMYQSILQMSVALEDPVIAMIGLKNATQFNKNISDFYALVNQFKKTSL